MKDMMQHPHKNFTFRRDRKFYKKHISWIYKERNAKWEELLQYQAAI